MKEKYSKLGLFTIELWRAKRLSVQESTGEFRTEASGAVPEKALKGQAIDVTTTSVLQKLLYYPLIFIDTRCCQGYARAP